MKRAGITIAGLHAQQTMIEAAPERGGPFATSTEKERSRLSGAQELPDFKPDRWVEGKLSGSPLGYLTLNGAAARAAIDASVSAHNGGPWHEALGQVLGQSAFPETRCDRLLHGGIPSPTQWRGQLRMRRCCGASSMAGWATASRMRRGVPYLVRPGERLA